MSMHDLEPIERASLDELRALQLQRLQWSVRHAYENSAHYRERFDAADRVIRLHMFQSRSSMRATCRR